MYAEAEEAEVTEAAAAEALAIEAAAADTATADAAAVAAADAAAAAGVDPEINEFVQTWGLDLECWDSLSAQPLDVRRAVMARFKPRQGTRDVKNLFMGFLKSMRTGVGMPVSGAVTNGQAPVAGQPRPNAKRAASAAFGTDYLDGSSTNSALDSSINSLVNDSAAAAGLLYDSTGAVYDNFAGYRSAAADQEVLVFAQTWGLDQSCVDQLVAQAPEVQRQVLDSFRPKPGTRDPTSLFHGFLKSMVYGPGKGKRVRTIGPM